MVVFSWNTTAKLSCWRLSNQESRLYYPTKNHFLALYHMHLSLLISSLPLSSLYKIVCFSKSSFRPAEETQDTDAEFLEKFNARTLKQWDHLSLVRVIASYL